MIKNTSTHLLLSLSVVLWREKSTPRFQRNLTSLSLRDSFQIQGINGHLAFNEAEEVSAEEFATRDTRVLAISRETRCANAIGDLNGAIDAMPVYAVTIGIKEIIEARKVVLGVFRPWHRAVVRQAIFDEPSGHFPVTLLQNHPDALILTNNIASERAF